MSRSNERYGKICRWIKYIFQRIKNRIEVLVGKLIANEVLEKL